MKQTRVYETLLRIFPNADLNLFLHFYHFWHDVDLALWCYGEIRKDEYLMVKSLLKVVLEGKC